MKRLAAIILTAALIPAAPAASQVLWERQPTGWSMGPIEHLRTIPVEAGSAVGGTVHDGYLYVTTWRSFSIYDVTNAAKPELVSVSDLGPQLINEGPATNGELLLLSNDAVTGALEVWDVGDKSAPELLGETTTPRADHIWTCVLDCSYAYGSGGSIVDLSVPATPAVVGDWRQVATVRATHTIREVAPGRVLTGSLPMHYLDASDPRSPVRLATVEPPTTRPSRTLPLGAPEAISGHLDWPGESTDRFALTSLETPFSDSCNQDSGALVTLDSGGHEETGAFSVADTHRITANGAPIFGQAPANALGCSPLGVDAHPDFARSRVAAVSWFESGVRIFHVAVDGELIELGGFIADGTESFMVAWGSRDILYSIDTARGIDVFRVDVPTGYRRPGTLASVSGGAAGPSEAPVISGDGDSVAFHSGAADLVPGDDNGATDVFVRDLATGELRLVSAAADGSPGNGRSGFPSISADGRFVAFESDAADLVPGDTNEVTDVFVRDLAIGETVRASLGQDGGEANGASLRPAIAAEGGHVAFGSLASNLIPGDANAQQDVFVRDLLAGTTELVSRSTEGVFGNNASFEASISGDGDRVAFASFATNLEARLVEERGGVIHSFVRDRSEGTTERLSVGPDGGPGNGYSSHPTISADGSTVAFWSLATNLIPSDRNTKMDVFVADLDTEPGLERVSLTSDGRETNDNVEWNHPSVSADGRYVAFGSDATNLSRPDVNVRLDAFVHDRLSGETDRVSIADREGAGSSWDPSISDDGRLVAFTTNAPDLVPGDTNGAEDILIRDRGAGAGPVSLEAVREGDSVEVAGLATFSGAVLSQASDPVGDGVADAGADLVGAEVVVRPEQEDVSVRVALTDVPVVRNPDDSTKSVAGAPGVVYTLAFSVDGVAHEVRFARTSQSPTAALYRCDDACVELETLHGRIGTGGADVRLAIPLASLGGAELLSDIGLTVGIGDGDTGTVGLMDELALPDAELLGPVVELGVAPAGTPAEEVAFTAQALLGDGAFLGTVDLEGSQGDLDVWARACLGDVCGRRSVALG